MFDATLECIPFSIFNDPCLFLFLAIITVLTFKFILDNLIVQKELNLKRENGIKIPK